MDRYCVHFANGKDVVVSARSLDSAEKKAAKAVPGIAIRVSINLNYAAQLRQISKWRASATPVY